MSATCEIWAEVGIPVHGGLMGRASNGSMGGFVMNRRHGELRRVCVIRDIIELANGADISVSERLVHQLVFLGQEFGTLGTHYHFAQKKWTPWSRELEADLDGWYGERFLALVRQPGGLGPTLRLGPRSRLLASPAHGADEMLPAAWLTALAVRGQNDRDLLVSAVRARREGLDRYEAHAVLVSLVGQWAYERAQRALEAADLFMVSERACSAGDLVPA